MKIFNEQNLHFHLYVVENDKDFPKKTLEFVKDITKRIQKNANKVIEVVISFNPKNSNDWVNNHELMNKIENYFNSSLTFLGKRNRK
jgi:malate/lactate dehydrogenase